MEMFGIWLALAAVVVIFGFVIIMLINDNGKMRKEVKWLESRIDKTPSDWKVQRLEKLSYEQNYKFSLLMDHFGLKYRDIDAHGVVEKKNNENS